MSDEDLSEKILNASRTMRKREKAYGVITQLIELHRHFWDLFNFGQIEPESEKVVTITDIMDKNLIDQLQDGSMLRIDVTPKDNGELWRFVLVKLPGVETIPESAYYSALTLHLSIAFDDLLMAEAKAEQGRQQLYESLNKTSDAQDRDALYSAYTTIPRAFDGTDSAADPTERAKRAAKIWAQEDKEKSERK